MALHLGEKSLLQLVFHAAPMDSLPLIVPSINFNFVKSVMSFLAEQLVNDNNLYSY